MFRDEAFIEVIAGKGGDGLVSFHTEKGVPRGGPDGGDGGNGGSVILVATSRESSLLRVGRHFRCVAGSGRPGGTKNCTGRGGEDTVVELPVGTLVYDRHRDNLLRDLAEDGARLEVALGGKGGKGNVRFATAVRQTPRRATRGAPGERRELRLELKLFADVGLVGLPNAGKSTFLSVVTAARPKIADYPFTTLDPQVGIAEVGRGQTLCIADLPGLIDGAAEGHGLGHRFLKHVERCRVLLQLVDVSESADRDPLEAWEVALTELREFSVELAEKPRLVVATKCEDEAAEERARALEEVVGTPVTRISALRHEGLRPLLGAAWGLVSGEDLLP